jgi:hypothetical protein
MGTKLMSLRDLRSIRPGTALIHDSRRIGLVIKIEDSHPSLRWPRMWSILKGEEVTLWGTLALRMDWKLLKCNGKKNDTQTNVSKGHKADNDR